MNELAIISAKYLFAVPVLILGIYFLFQPRRSQKKMLIFALPALALAYLLGMIANHAYVDPRPFVEGNFIPLIPHAPDNGFPSDHALIVSAIASIGTVWNKKLGIVLWILAAIVAWGRVYTGVHHPIDVIASAAIAILSTAIVYFSLRRGLHTDVR
jgi:undecaprenyl-diphosphatase